MDTLTSLLPRLGVLRVKHVFKLRKQWPNGQMGKRSGMTIYNWHEQQQQQHSVKAKPPILAPSVRKGSSWMKSVLLQKLHHKLCSLIKGLVLIEPWPWKSIDQMK